MQKFDPVHHIDNLIDDPYYEKLILLRNLLSMKIDSYFQSLHAPRVDLYMVTGSVSSPMGKGSDSEPWPVTMGNIDTYLVDSAQFGMEPLVQKNFDMVYCYLPSFRGETPDNTHLNQFYHCEAELKGPLSQCMKIVEGLFAETFTLFEDSTLTKIIDPKRYKLLKEVVSRPVEQIDFNEAITVLGSDQALIEHTSHGRVITRKGEIELSRQLFNHQSLFWLTGYDRDTVPFYQKPNPEDENRVMNADLLLPPIGDSGFAGEVLGSGQRQDSVAEIHESIRRQVVEGSENYDWYIKLRTRPDYQMTSGFGLGIERFVSWLMGTDDIASAALYPVMNTVKTLY